MYGALPSEYLTMFFTRFDATHVVARADAFASMAWFSISQRQRKHYSPASPISQFYAFLSHDSVKEVALLFPGI